MVRTAEYIWSGNLLVCNLHMIKQILRIILLIVAAVCYGIALQESQAYYNRFAQHMILKGAITFLAVCALAILIHYLISKQLKERQMGKNVKLTVDIVLYLAATLSLVMIYLFANRTIRIGQQQEKIYIPEGKITDIFVNDDHDLTLKKIASANDMTSALNQCEPTGEYSVLKIKPDVDEYRKLLIYGNGNQIQWVTVFFLYERDGILILDEPNYGIYTPTDDFLNLLADSAGE